MKLSLKLLVVIIVIGTGINYQVYSIAGTKTCWHNGQSYMTVSYGQQCEFHHDLIGSDESLHSGESPDDCLLLEIPQYGHLN